MPGMTIIGITDLNAGRDEKSMANGMMDRCLTGHTYGGVPIHLTLNNLFAVKSNWPGVHSKR